MFRFAGFTAALLLIGMTSAAGETIGFSEVANESEWRTAFSADMRSEAGNRGIDMRTDDARQTPNGLPLAGQFATVRRFIAERVDAIVISPLVVTGWTPVLKEAQAANIPVFIADRSVDADPSLFVARIGADFNLEGRLAASWLAQASRGRCAILELRGPDGAMPSIERAKGFAAVIAQFPGMRIVRSEGGGFTSEGGRRAMEQFIKSPGWLKDGGWLKDVCAVWSHDDSMLLGAVEAMKEAGVHPGKGMLTISVDGIPGIFHAMLAGEATASVEHKSNIGGPIFSVVQGYLAGRRDYPKWVLIPTDLHTREDAADMLARRGGS